MKYTDIKAIELNMKAKLKSKEELEEYGEIPDLTYGKVYEIKEVRGLHYLSHSGEFVCDYILNDDKGEERILGNFLFEVVVKE